MAKYRIIERSVLEVTGKVSVMGCTTLYTVQRKHWFGWKNIKGLTYCATLEYAKMLLDLYEKGRLDKKGREIVYER